MTSNISAAICATAFLVNVFSPASSLAANAGEDPTFTIELGSFLVATKTDVRVDGNTARGSDIDLEEELGFTDVNRFRAEGAWRFAKRHSLHAMYFNNDRTQTHTIERTLQFGDTTIPVGAVTTSKFQTEITDVTYEYMFLQRPTYEVGASFGLHIISFEVGLDATVTAPGGSRSRVVNAVDTGAPLPLFGLRGKWQINDRWEASARAQYFALSLEGYEGSIGDYSAETAWMFTTHLGVGVGYNQFQFDVDVDKRLFVGSIGWQYGGGILFVRGAF